MIIIKFHFASIFLNLHEFRLKHTKKVQRHYIKMNYNCFNELQYFLLSITLLVVWLLENCSKLLQTSEISAGVDTLFYGWSSLVGLTRLAVVNWTHCNLWTQLKPQFTDASAFNSFASWTLMVAKLF